jgi:aminoglycoside phosphotransferase (APT) family kinase protein
MRRVQRGPLPALEQLVEALHARRPEPGTTFTLVHGDAKSGNFAFDGDEVSAVYDWEMATVGDPLADIAWAELIWAVPGSFTSHPASLTVDEFVAYWEQLTGITARHREWYRAFQGLKLSVILLVAAMLFDRGDSDDLRFAYMGAAIHPSTQRALRDLGVEDDVDSGPVTARPERLAEVREASAPSP